MHFRKKMIVEKPEWICLIILLVLGSLASVPDVRAQVPPGISVRWYPAPPTPNDTVITVRANVTSSVEIKNVTIHYKIGPSGIRFNSLSDYNETKMQLLTGNLNNGLWDYDFGKQANGTVIYFFVSAIDITGVQSSWPGNYPDFKNPEKLYVTYPNRPYLASVYLYLNKLFLSDTLQQANITLTMEGYLPQFPEAYWMPIYVQSSGQYTFFIDESNGAGRFFYAGKTSQLVYLTGNPGQVPYDTYTLNITLTIPYRFDNLSRILVSTPFVIFSSNDIWNSWNVPQPTVNGYQRGNDTDLVLSSTLSRRVPIYYPPLVLMIVALAVLGLNPLVSTYYPTKRFDLFLNAIILGSSAELSQTLNSIGGFQGDNAFLQTFFVILVSAVFMMGVSSLPPKVRKWSKYKLPLEFFTTIVVVLVAWAFILPTNFPWFVRVFAVPLAGSSGTILLFLSIHLRKHARD